MALHYTLIFALLVFECSVFVTLILPLPHRWRRNLLYVVSRSKAIAFVFYWMRVVFAFVFLLFIDAVIRMQKTQEELHAEPIVNAQMESQLHARKFYSQRNVYLTGFTLFLGLILTGTYNLILDLLHREDELDTLKQDLEATRKELDVARKRVADFEILKKQAEGQHDEYMRLADKHNALEARSPGQVSSIVEEPVVVLKEVKKDA
ncbi:B-cell receptor-associated protein 31-like-domain-containing protein [Dimargaris cristalligena]|uniref:Endoplasmic reticulum transmembrane protein n=1 Tax=Dimargaris cristalligena TaxID=215637 RepID=A0A4Q0A016_9FUNG|nr:B-cell receptor-associated protein 31-like-domain-containing protein [Dimargaris cristalligena]|eukprot:RKP39355.1 B-cell receptor-associated protein 31-like-domain-containing protein [Dimargaris cristalligena]